LRKFTKFFVVIGLIAVMAMSVPFFTGCEAETVTTTKTTTVTSTSAATVTSVSTETVENTVTSISTVTETLVSTVTGVVQLISVIDDAGVTYTFEKPVNSIISLSPTITEMVYFVNAGDTLIGRTDYCSYPEGVNQVESIGGYFDPNKEKILLLDADVVLADSIQCTTGDVEWLQSQGVTVIVLAPSDIEGVMRDIILIGEITGNKTVATDAVAGLKARINAVTDAISNVNEEDKPSILHITWHDPLWTVGEHSFLDAIINMAGGINIFADVEWDVMVDLEQAVARNPDFITIVSDQGSRISYDYVTAEDSPFKATNAYLNDCVFMVDADIVSRASQRIVDALEFYAKLFYPEIFSNILITE